MRRTVEPSTGRGRSFRAMVAVAAFAVATTTLAAGFVAPSASAATVQRAVTLVATHFTSVTANNTAVGYGGGTDLRGIVLDAKNARVAGKPVELWSAVPGAAYARISTATTSATGTYIFSPRTLTKTVNYQVRFPATTTLAASSGPVQLITVAKSNTTLTAALANLTVPTGATTVFSGQMTDVLHRVAASQRVEIWSLTGAATVWAHVGSATTNASGNYSFTTAKLTASSSFQARYTATTYMNAVNSIVVKATVVPVVIVPGTPYPGWYANPALAQDTAVKLNAYRVAHGLPALTIIPAPADVENCVRSNMFGTFCDPGNYAAGFTTGPAVVAAWDSSVEHKSAMLSEWWSTISCAAYSNVNDAHVGNVGCQFLF